MRRGTIVFCMILNLLCFAACGRETVPEWDGQVQRVTVDREDAGETAEEPLRINMTLFEDLPKVAAQAGFSFRAVENPGGEWHFDNCSLYQEGGAGAKDGAYTVVRLSYRLGQSIAAYNLEMRLSPDPGEERPPYVTVEEIEGVEVFYTKYTLKVIGAAYERTAEEIEEDERLMAAGDYSVSVGSAGDEVEYSYFYGAYWTEDGVFYRLASRPNNTMEEVQEIVRAMLEDGTYQGGAD